MWQTMAGSNKQSVKSKEKQALVVWTCLQTQELFQGTIEGRRRQGRPRKMWLDNVKDWTRLSIDYLFDSILDTAQW